MLFYNIGKDLAVDVPLPKLLARKAAGSSQQINLGLLD
jgi:hypothetical protein